MAWQQQAQPWFETLRDLICKAFEEIEDLYAAQKGGTPGRFERKAWDRPEGGGGVMSIMRGQVFEKVGVNCSTVWGEFNEKFRKEIPGADADPTFWASGISLVAHLTSPLVPAVHMNTRFITTSKTWFGGGADLNPMYPDDQDTADFHGAFKEVCDRFDPTYHPRFKAWCDEYFFIRHRNESRGVGGIFYDYLNSGDWDQDFAFTRAVGEAFWEIYPRLVKRHMFKDWTPEQRAHQLFKRGRYAEFNLIYDRGTKFGLETNGNAEAILMSLPPLATWA
ncbi:MAG: oxygen-dependent coproporphyrinogen oxidase [Holosporales bacterium]